MPLADLRLSVDSAPPPGDVRAFLREATRRVERFQLDHHIPAFVPCDFEAAYGVLRALAEGVAAPGNLFCEWGSGFGVVACLAAMLDFDACGIEIEPALVAAARRLADDFGLPVEFVRGSFIPRGSSVSLDGGGFAWLTTDGGDAGEETGLCAADFDVIFAYPWPDEEGVIGELFERHGREGAVLVTCHENSAPRLRRRIPLTRRGRSHAD